MRVTAVAASCPAAGHLYGCSFDWLECGGGRGSHDGRYSGADSSWWVGRDDVLPLDPQAQYMLCVYVCDNFTRSVNLYMYMYMNGLLASGASSDSGHTIFLAYVMYGVHTGQDTACQNRSGQGREGRRGEEREGRGGEGRGGEERRGEGRGACELKTLCTWERHYCWPCTNGSY